MSVEAYRRRVDNKITSMRNDRTPWMQDWRDLADFILPRRYRWLVAVNQSRRNLSMTGNIVDETGTLAARTLAGGMTSGIASPTRTWFKLKISGYEQDEEVARWLSVCQKRMMEVFHASNFYSAIAVHFFDLVVFGTACVIVHEDYENVVHFFNPALGEFFYELDDKFNVVRVGREFVLTCDQMVDQFGEDSLSESARVAYRNGQSQQFLINHLIEKNDGDYGLPVGKNFPYREVFWESGSPRTELLKAKGFYSWPVMTPRWDVTENDPYGTGPGFDALGGIKQLQMETRRKAENIDFGNRPPIVADIALQGNPMALVPKGVTFVAGLGAGRKGAEPVYTVQPMVAEMRQDIQEIQQRIKLTFHNDLFTGITDLQTVRTATEIDARREEKLVLLGPVLERVVKESLNVVIDRVWDIMQRGGLFPPPPASLRGKTTMIHVDYISMLAIAQRGLATAGIEKLWGFAGNIASVQPKVLNKLDPYATIEEYADALGVEPKIVRGEDEVAELDATQERQAAMAQMAQAAPAAAQGAQTLSQTPVGGAASALDLILGTNVGPPQ